MSSRRRIIVILVGRNKILVKCSTYPEQLLMCRYVSWANTYE